MSLSATVELRHTQDMLSQNGFLSLIFLSFLIPLGCAAPIATQQGQVLLHNRTPNVIPGVGIQRLRLGLTSQEVKRLLGAPSKTRTEALERRLFVAHNKNIARTPLLFRRFDLVFEYHSNRPEKRALEKDGYPVFKAYFHKDRLVHIVLSSYIYKTAGKGYSIGSYDAFGAVEGLVKALGTPLIVPVSGYGGSYLWLSRGLECIVDQGRVRAIHIYAPFSVNEITAFLAQ